MMKWQVSLIEAGWGLYASVNNDIIGSDRGLLPVQNQAIIRNTSDLLSVGLLEMLPLEYTST